MERETLERHAKIIALNDSIASYVRHEGQTIACSLLVGPTIMCVVALRDLSFDKYTTSADDDDLTLMITHQEGISALTVRSVAEAFLFELNASYGIVFDFAPYITEAESSSYGSEVHDETERFVQAGPLRLRPLPTPERIADLLSLFRRANAVQDDEFAVLNYVRVVEYVAATVEKRSIHRELRRKLMSSDALDPSAEFIDSVVKLVDEGNKTFKKDADAIRMAIAECCSFEIVTRHAPTFLKDLRKLGPRSSDESKQDGLRKVSDALVATRNEIAHAKPTYRRTGLECPPSDLAAFRQLASKIAEEAVRWFLDLSPNHRVTASP
mgnify:CR=1 FL=1